MAALGLPFGEVKTHVGDRPSLHRGPPEAPLTGLGGLAQHTPQDIELRSGKGELVLEVCIAGKDTLAQFRMAPQTEVFL